MLVLFTGLAWRDVRRLVGVEPTLLAMTGWLPAAPPGPDPEQQP
jgi:hypothetical protein